MLGEAVLDFYFHSIFQAEVLYRTSQNLNINVE